MASDSSCVWPIDDATSPDGSEKWAFLIHENFRQHMYSNPDQFKFLIFQNYPLIELRKSLIWIQSRNKIFVLIGSCSPGTSRNCRCDSDAAKSEKSASTNFVNAFKTLLHSPLLLLGCTSNKFRAYSGFKSPIFREQKRNTSFSSYLRLSSNFRAPVLLGS